MQYTKSIRAAARYLGCSYQHLAPYMRSYRVDENDPNSPTLFEAHKNQHGKGIPKFLPNKRREPNVKKIFTEGVGWESFTPEKIKVRGIAEGFLKEECYKCSFHERRVSDYRMPLLLFFKDGNKVNYLKNNLELLCYNCYFLYGGDVLTDSQTRHIESNQTVKEKEFDFGFSDDMLDNMKALGLLD